ncbi:putative OTU-like cysteine protease [Aspergillus steynii IBT 23096]|uniref:Ubiquitin thioesterase OTU n=1 Tax=Aspergillus steynii IBT 23096 TaxID=1392250 RepID=A0A2I2GFU3_9EURO|nr:putative OTU-like cysteine protease [Aspergillus steynii IBT 23096]PLB51743.1 putative OTU-like cysteine protease [Aspergillus steynii IBT 23096]
MGMKLRIRGPEGQSTVLLDDSATVGDLRNQVVNATGLTTYEVKYGYPDLKPLALDGLELGSSLQEHAINLHGEQLIVTRKGDDTLQDSGSSGGPPISVPSQSLAPTGPPSPAHKPQNTSDDAPEIASSEHAGTFILRIMPDDNSCLFRAVGTALMGGMDAMNELRSVVAQTIQERPDLYSEAVLDKRPDDYCRWIQNEDSWGGGIELSILSKHFDIEICSIDVQTLRVDRFNEGPPTRCILVYSGIHYDTIALSPSAPPFAHTDAPPEFDTKVFDSADGLVLEKALALCKILQGRHYYTDTAGFRIRCNTCGGIFTGEKGATQHAAQTGHYDFGEAS